MKVGHLDTEGASIEISDEEDGRCTSSPKHAKKPITTGRLLHTKINLKRIVINVSDTQYSVVSDVAEDLDWKVQTKADAGDWDVFWTDSAVLPDILFKMHFFQKINHYPGIHYIARKNLLGLSLMAMKEAYPNEYNFFPITWMLPSEFPQFRQYYESVTKGKARTYIVKPEADCQGRGIFLTRNIEDVFNGNHYVVQKYVNKPFLIQGLKFDFRIYVLLAGTDPLRIYLYDEGLVRLATEPYEEPSPTNLTNMCMHLTNYAVNKNNPKFIFNTSDKNMGVGHKRSLKAVFSMFQRAGNDVKSLRRKIKDVVIKTLIPGIPLINHQYRYCQPQEYSGNMCFHILGLDIMLNDKFEPILLEVNHTPSFTTDTPLDSHIKYKLIKDTLTLMNINIQMKRKLFNKAKECNEQRLLTGKRRIYNGYKKEEEVQRSQKERDEYETNHMGGFEKIHPTADPELDKKYKKFLEHAKEIYIEDKAMRARVVKNQKSQKDTLHGPKSQRIFHGTNTITGVKYNGSSMTPSPRKKTPFTILSYLQQQAAETPKIDVQLIKESFQKPRQESRLFKKFQAFILQESQKRPERNGRQLKLATSMENRKRNIGQELQRNRMGNFIQPKIYDINEQNEMESKNMLAVSYRFQKIVNKKPSISRIKQLFAKKLIFE